MSDESHALLRLICLDYHGCGHPEGWSEARAMLRDVPGLASANIFVAAALGNVADLCTYLEGEASLAKAKGGPFGWEPLLYLCYGRLVLEGENQDFLASARLLLQHGADPNAFFWWEDICKFTALTGAFGEGEKGPEDHPPHPQSLALAKLLLDSGADPNDGQALYNTMLRPGTSSLELMLEYGLEPAHQINWVSDQKLGTLDYLLGHAVDKGDQARVRCLLSGGANPGYLSEAGISMYRRAIRQGKDEIAEILADAGATVDTTTADHLHGAIARQDLFEARTLIQERPALVERLHNEDRGVLHHVAAHNLVESMVFLLENGCDVNLREENGYRHTPLHKAAMNGHLGMAGLLRERGADLSIKDAVYAGVPAGWARHHGHEAVAEYLEKPGEAIQIGEYRRLISGPELEDHRPWGFFEILSDRIDHKVKRITVFPGQRLSYQRHFRRSEHWFVVRGNAVVTAGKDEVDLTPGHTIDLPVRTWHRVRNPGPKNLVFIEVQTGDYFGEDDIERAEDDYGRV